MTLVLNLTAKKHQKDCPLEVSLVNNLGSARMCNTDVIDTNIKSYQ